MQIFVKTITGRSEVLDVQAAHTVMDVKDLLFSKTGIPPYLQRLIHSGRQLELEEEEKTLQSYNIEKETTLHLVLRLRAGMRQHTHAIQKADAAMAEQLVNAMDNENLMRKAVDKKNLLAEQAGKEKKRAARGLKKKRARIDTSDTDEGESPQQSLTPPTYSSTAVKQEIHYLNTPPHSGSDPLSLAPMQGYLSYLSSPTCVPSFSMQQVKQPIMPIVQQPEQEDNADFNAMDLLKFEGMDSPVFSDQPVAPLAAATATLSTSTSASKIIKEEDPAEQKPMFFNSNDLSNNNSDSFNYESNGFIWPDLTSPTTTTMTTKARQVPATTNKPSMSQTSLNELLGVLAHEQKRQANELQELRTLMREIKDLVITKNRS